jgi:hypothetical protein
MLSLHSILVVVVVVVVSTLVLFMSAEQQQHLLLQEQHLQQQAALAAAAAHQAALQHQQQEQAQLLLQAQQENTQLRAQLAALAHSSSSSSSLLPSGFGGHAGEFRVKPMQPSLFTGGMHGNAEQWLQEMERFFLASNMAGEQSHVLYASTYLKDAASTWFNSLWPEDQRAQHIQQCSWDDFKEKFRARYRPLAPARMARTALRTLIQKNKVAGYTDAFLKQVQLIPDMSMPDQVDAYINGLHTDIAEEVDRGDPDTLAKAMDLAQRAEARLTHRRGQKSYGSSTNAYTRRYIERRVVPVHVRNEDRMDLSVLQGDEDGSSSDGNSSSTSLHVMQAQRRGGARRSSPRRFGSSSTHVRTRVPELSREDFDRLSREGKCFCCREAGHLARNCPKRASSSTPSAQPTKPKN